MDKYSDYYYEVIEKYKLFHKDGIKNQPGFSTFLGYSLSKWIIKIKEIIRDSGSDSLIDFGCGYSRSFFYFSKYFKLNYIQTIYISNLYGLYIKKELY